MCIRDRIMMTICLTAVTFQSLIGLLQAHYRDLGCEAKYFSYFMMSYGLSSSAFRYLSGIVTSRRDPLKVASIGYLISTVALISLGFEYEIPGSLLVAFLYGIGLGLVIPSQQLVVISSVPEGLRNRAMSLYAMGFDLGGFLGPLAYGWLASSFGYQYAYEYLGVPLFIALLLVVYLDSQGSFFRGAA